MFACITVITVLSFFDNLSIDSMYQSTRFVENPTKFLNLRQLTLFCHIFKNPYPEANPLVVLRLTQILESAPQLEHFELHVSTTVTLATYIYTSCTSMSH